MAERFGVAVSYIVKWHQRSRETGSVAPGTMGRHRKIILGPHRDFILKTMTCTPYLTIRGLQELLAQLGIHVSRRAVWQFLRREGLSLKKSLFGLEQARADVARKRNRWKRLMGLLNPQHLIFIDETWIQTNVAL